MPLIQWIMQNMKPRGSALGNPGLIVGLGGGDDAPPSAGNAVTITLSASLGVTIELKASPVISIELNAEPL